MSNSPSQSKLLPTLSAPITINEYFHFIWMWPLFYTATLYVAATYGSWLWSQFTGNQPAHTIPQTAYLAGVIFGAVDFRWYDYRHRPVAKNPIQSWQMNAYFLFFALVWTFALFSAIPPFMEAHFMDVGHKKEDFGDLAWLIGSIFFATAIFQCRHPIIPHGQDEHGRPTNKWAAVIQKLKAQKLEQHGTDDSEGF